MVSLPLIAKDFRETPVYGKQQYPTIVSISVLMSTAQQEAYLGCPQKAVVIFWSL